MNLDLKTPRSIEEEKIEYWSDEIEKLLAEWSEIALCYSWLHSYSERKYKRKYHRFSIPIIVLSTLTGTANFGMDSFIDNPDTKQYASAIIGGFNIFAGISRTSRPRPRDLSIRFQLGGSPPRRATAYRSRCRKCPGLRRTARGLR